MTWQTLSRHWRLVSSIVALAVFLWLLYALRGAAFSFILGLLVAYLLMPVIWWFEKRLPAPGKLQQTKRITLIILIFIAILGLLSVLSFYVASAVIESSIVLINQAPQYTSSAFLQVQDWLQSFRSNVPPEMQQTVDQFIHDAAVTVGNAIRDSFFRGVSLIPGTLGVVFSLAALPIFLFFVMKDWEKLGRSFYSGFPTWAERHARNVTAIIENTLGRYIRAQIFLGLVVGVLVFIGLAIMKIPFAPVLSTLAAVTEAIPTVGPLIAGSSAVIVTLATAPEKAVWVGILFIVVQQLENQLLVPRIQGSYLRMNPAIIIVLLVIGSYIAGFWGLLLTIPLAATFIEIYKYVVAQTKQKDSSQSRD